MTNLDTIPWQYRPIKMNIRRAFSKEKLEPITIMAICYKGLAYHPAFNNNRNEEPKGWCVTHIKTGLRLGGAEEYDATHDFETEDRAAEFLIMVSDLCNWKDMIAIKENAKQLRMKIKKLYSEFIVGKD